MYLKPRHLIEIVILAEKLLRSGLQTLHCPLCLQDFCACLNPFCHHYQNHFLPHHLKTKNLNLLNWKSLMSLSCLSHLCFVTSIAFQSFYVLSLAKICVYSLHAHPTSQTHLVHLKLLLFDKVQACEFLVNLET